MSKFNDMFSGADVPEAAIKGARHNRVEPAVLHDALRMLRMAGAETTQTSKQGRAEQLCKRVVVHLLQQGGPAAASGGSCAYRAGDKSCAVGCLIKDNLYSENLEGRAVHNMDVIHAVETSLGYRLADNELLMLQLLQRMHDEFVRYVPRITQSWEDYIKQEVGKIVTTLELRMVPEDFNA